MRGPKAKRAAVAVMREQTVISECRAYRLVGLSRTILHYRHQACAENDVLTTRATALANERRRLGYHRIHALLGRAGILANHKRVYWLYKVGRVDSARPS